MNGSRSAKHLKHLRAGRACLQNEKYGDALAHFVFLGNVAPSWKPDMESDFLIALCKWVDVLQSHKEVGKIMTCFQQALQLYPNNETLLTNIGATLLKLGLTDEAACMFRRAIQLNPSSTIAREGLESVASALVERWHFRMLNDRQRNLAYKKAISNAVSNGCDIVLDIGSGSGILSMFAVQAGAKKVYACEMSKTMYELSKDVLLGNQMESFIEVIHKKSTDLLIGKDLPGRVSLVCTETLDCGLLGEGILKTISHAWEALLQEKKSITSTEQQIDGVVRTSGISPMVIPRGAKLYGQVIESSDIRHQSYCRPNVAGFNVRIVKVIGGEQLEQENTHLDQEAIEPYTTECLDSLQGGYKPLTEPFVITEYDFTKPSTLCSERKPQVIVPVSQPGNMDAIAVWFDLHLDETTTISTAPGKGSLCWEQAVFPVYPHHLPGKMVETDNEWLVSVDKGQSIVIKGRLNEEFVSLQCTSIEPSNTRKGSCVGVLNSRAEVTAMEIEGGESLLDSNVKTEVMVDQRGCLAIIPPPLMLKANDDIYHTTWRDAIDRSIKEILKQGNGCKVVCLSHGGLQLQALVAARAGATEIILPHSTNCLATKAISVANGIPDKVFYGDMELEDIATRGQSWDLLLTDLVEPSGVLQPQAVEDIVFSKGCLLRKDMSMVIPSVITVYCMFIESPALMNICKVVSDENTLGLKITDYMNAFHVSTQVNVELSSLPYTRLSEEFTLFTLDFMKPSQKDEDLLQMLELSSKHKVKITNDGVIQALPYWFNMALDGSHTLSTYSRGYPGSHWRQAVCVVTKPIKVSKGDEVVVEVMLKGSCISLVVTKPSAQ
ncbi:predicted protein [Nematostella vectensis]|uniref:Protein arginine N-methyltransferase domain-containing protein n=1 Tax=Nematostella vectensis TaxID=45351 RepID=A7SBZ7_NEMVE|nr:protein arginine N-methyltransferase 9 [Nematostella vectensis]EDO38718.1 predicted protein [Nematostella vectensis]|eukprot:XP_001630781.1 predicted protein [Nematostella vectensis]